MVCFSLLASLIAFNVAYVSYYYQVLLLGLLTLLSYQQKKEKATQCEEIHKVENSQFPSYPLQGLWSQIFGNCFFTIYFFDAEQTSLLKW